MTQKNNEYKSIMDHVEIPEDVWNQTLEVPCRKIVNFPM